MNLFKGLFCAALCAGICGCHNETSSSGGGSSSGLKALKIDDVKVGDGDAADLGDVACVEYSGALASGVEFDSNMPSDPNKPEKAPFSFTLDPLHPSVIKGWVDGVKGMKVGGERKLSIPSYLAYGATSHGSIPANSDLFFDIKLLGLVKKGHEFDLGVKDVKIGTGPEVKKLDYVTISYEATLINGLHAFSSKEHPPALQFQAGTGDSGTMTVPMIGVVEGVLRMKVGGERILICPPALASSPAAGALKLPGDSILKFDIKLLRISKTMESPIMEATK